MTKKKTYTFHVLTGGGAGALDAIDGALLQDEDTAMGVTDAGPVFYILDADSGAAESSPDRIAPDVNAGTKRWIKSDLPIDGGIW